MHLENQIVAKGSMEVLLIFLLFLPDSYGGQYSISDK